MKKIISIISSIITILAGTVFMNSCRQQDDERTLDPNPSRMKSVNNVNSKISDSMRQTSIPQKLDEEIVETDPPPKNGGQWKVRD